MNMHVIEVARLAPAVTGRKKTVYRTTCSCGWTFRGDYTRHRTVADDRGRDHIDEMTRPQCPHPYKKKFGTQAKAEQSMATVWQKSRRGGPLPSRAYECVCGYWHLTKTARKEPA